MDPADLRKEEEPSGSISDGFEDPLFGGHSKSPRTPSPPVDPLEAQLQASALDCRQPLISFQDFYNEHLSDSVEMDKDFTNFKSEPGVS